MAVICPYCRHAMNVKGAKPGRYTPKCAKCGRVFRLVVPDDPTGPMKVEPVQATSKPTAATTPPKPQAAPPAPPRPSPAAAHKQPPATRPTPAFNPDVTAPEAASAPPFNPDTTAPEGMGVPSSAGNVNPSASPDGSNDKADRTAALPGNEAYSAPTGTPQSALEQTAAGDAPADGSPDGQGMPSVLGGYQVLKQLGMGGMGAVYLARQMSLDRNVALKVMRPEWASNPTFMARFTREAYAAAQLVHHNVIQIYDIGIDKGINYFSMEFVEGKSLGDVVKKEGKLAPETAAGYVLQAARGLKFAHDRGMIHRDIKPDNLMLNDHGIVKVADLGLVKTPGADDPPLSTDASPPGPARGKTVASDSKLASVSDITMAHSAMGTPAYMAPEQARDATSVDGRADIYSLGCTLYLMVTGKPLFTGKSALEVMTKHATQPVTRPEAIVKNLPRAVSDIIMKMVAKKPEERYPDCADLARALEGFLGAGSGGKPFAPGEEHTRILEQGVKGFCKAPLARLRSLVLTGFFGSCGVLFLVCLLFGARWWLTGAFLGLGVLTALSYFLIHGSSQRTLLFLKVREYVLGASVTDWITAGAGLFFFTGLLYLFGLFWAWLAVLLLAVGIAAGLYYGLDRRIAEQRRKPLEKVEQMLKGMRLKGMSEEQIQQFVCQYAGEHWEEFFEALFGFEAKLAARARWGAGPKGPRPKFGAWREPMLAALEARQRARQAARERKLLQALEEKKLQAEGIGAAEARQKAERAADVLVRGAEQLKKAAAEPPPDEAADAERTTAEADARTVAREAQLRRQVQSLLEADAAAEEQDVTPRPGLLSRLLGPFFGPRARFVYGVVLLGCSVYWMKEKHLLPGSDEKATLGSIWSALVSTREPLHVDFVPPLVSDLLFSCFNPGVAGALLIVSALFSGWKLGVLLVPAAVLMVAGHVLGVPDVGPLAANNATLAGGLVLALLGFLLGREKE